jgi:glycosyltransferase domain-containing protein
MDGSKNPIEKNLERILNRHKEIYFWSPNKTVGQRISEASQKITTPFCVTCNDDDYLFRSGVFKALEMLNSRMDIVGCRGQSLRIDVNNLQNARLNQIFNRYENFGVTGDNANSRITQAFFDYNGAALFSVLRTVVWQKSWREAYSHSFSSTNVNEFFQNISVYIYGKLVTFNSPYICETNENAATNTLADNRSLLFGDWAKSEVYFEEKSFFINSLSNKLCEVENIALEDAREVISQAINQYIKLHQEHNLTSYFFKSKLIKKLIYFCIKYLKKSKYINVYLGMREQLIPILIRRKSIRLEELINKPFKNLKFFDFDSSRELIDIYHGIIESKNEDFEMKFEAKFRV